jgi:hypothetical protein
VSAVLLFLAALFISALWLRSSKPVLKHVPWIGPNYPDGHYGERIGFTSRNGRIALYFALQQPDGSNGYPALREDQLTYWRVGMICLAAEGKMDASLCNRMGFLALVGRRSLILMFPHWAALAITMLLPLFWGRRILRRRLLETGRLCVCGYDLRATPDRCPECGKIPETAVRLQTAQVANQADRRTRGKMLT